MFEFLGTSLRSPHKLASGWGHIANLSASSNDGNLLEKYRLECDQGTLQMCVVTHIILIHDFGREAGDRVCVGCQLDFTAGLVESRANNIGAVIHVLVK